MKDIFDTTILCDRCHLKMKRVDIDKNGFVLRAVKCDNCAERIIHPQDKQEYEQFNNLRNKSFRVKLRLVGNSYAVSIPKEIIHFMHEQEKIMNDMVRLCFEDAKRLSLNFFDEDDEDNESEKENVKKYRIRIKNEDDGE